jgi:hypothetical protein
MAGNSNLGESRIKSRLFYGNHIVQDILWDWFLDSPVTATSAPYSRIRTTKTEIILTRGGGEHTIPRSKLLPEPTALEVKTDIHELFGVGAFDDLFIHVNRDNTIAIATGQAPPVWPEDEV